MRSPSDPLPGIEGELGSGTSFGVNAAQVWTFLGELRELDLDRAIRVWEGYSAARSGGYERALRAAEKVARKRRPDAWLLARRAATVAARERLPEPVVTQEIVDVLANAAAGIVVRDLLSPRHFELLQRPWTWRTDAATPTRPAVAAAAIASAPVDDASGAKAGPPPEAGGRAKGGGARFRPSWRRGPHARTLVPALVALVVLIGVATALGATLMAPPGEVAVVGPTGTQPATAVATASVVSSPVASAVGVAVASPSPLGTAPAPSATSVASKPPATRTAAPIVAATRAPVATPAPTRTPRPTQQPQCKVISLIGVPTAAAQARWSEAGFRGAVTFAPAVPPHYVIAWQSLAVNLSVACTSGITVSDAAP